MGLSPGNPPFRWPQTSAWPWPRSLPPPTPAARCASQIRGPTMVDGVLKHSKNYGKTMVNYGNYDDLPL